MKMQVLCDNRASSRGILAEHGLSLLIEHGESRILFDAGQSDVFMRNAAFMRADLAAVDALVVSHGHYDHTGGMVRFSGTNKSAGIYLHPGSLNQRCRPSKTDQNTMIDIGITDAQRLQGSLQERLFYTESPFRISQDITVSGSVPRCFALEADPGDFFVSDASGNLVKDFFDDEQFLMIEGEKGVYVFIGCAHAGVMNCIEYAKQLSDNKRIAGVIAGMHMENMPRERYEATVDYLRGLAPDIIVPLHCTGIVAIAEMKNIFGEKCMICGAGDSVYLD